MTLALMAATPIQAPDGQPDNPNETVFACQYFKNDREADDGWVHSVDMRLVARTDGSWTVQTTDQAVAVATSFPAKFGSVGRSLGLHWQDAKGNAKTAYVSFSDTKLPNGIQYFWLSFDRPSLWKAPGYGCQSQGDDATGAGT